MTRTIAGRHGRIRRGLRWLTPPLMLLTAGCATSGSATSGPIRPAGDQPVSFADCTALGAPPTPASSTPASSASAGAGLPDLVLPCFATGRSFRMTDLRGPAVINFWATSCGPCRAELPAVQRLADRTAGRLHVVGVDTADSPDAAASFGIDLGITFPNLFDTAGSLQRLIGGPYLPMTVFVDAAGRRQVYNGRALDDTRLAELVSAHTGVMVTS